MKIRKFVLGLLVCLLGFNLVAKAEEAALENPELSVEASSIDQTATEDSPTLTLIDEESSFDEGEDGEVSIEEE